MHLLSKGYSIRGTSRRATTAESLLTGPYAPYASRVKMYEVPDMTVSGAFDEAVKGKVNSLEKEHNLTQIQASTASFTQPLPSPSPQT